MICFTRYASPLGEMLLAADGEALTGAWFDGQKYFARTLPPDAREQTVPILRDAMIWLDTYFSGGDPGVPSPLRPMGTPFQREVWDILLMIPYGRTMTYGQIAAMLARRRGLPRMSAQAVGSAVGRNPISVFIPCHRVVGSGGSLTGYAGGIQRKTALLRLEQGE